MQLTPTPHGEVPVSVGLKTFKIPAFLYDANKSHHHISFDGNYLFSTFWGFFYKKKTKPTKALGS